MDDFIYFVVHGDFLVALFFAILPLITLFSMIAAYGIHCWREERQYKKMRKNGEI